MASWLASGIAGRPVSAIITGSEELGLQSAIAVAVDRASQLGFATIHASAPDIPGLVWSQVLRELGAANTDVPLDAFGLNAVRRAIGDAANATAPMLLVFEEAHRHERIDLALMEDLIRTPPASHLVILVGFDPGLSTPPALNEHQRRFVELSSTVARCHRFELLSLSMTETVEAIEARAETASATARFTADLHEFCSGTPEYVQLVLDQLGALEDSTRGHLLTGSFELRGMPISPDDATRFHRRLSGLSEGARLVLGALGGWLQPATPPQVEALTGLAEDALNAAISELEAVSTLHSRSDLPLVALEPTCPVEAWALAQTASLLRQQQLCERAAGLARELLAAGAPNSTVIARHLAGSESMNEGDIEAVAGAARDLIEQSRYASAHQLLLRLLESIKRMAPAVSAPAAVQVMFAETASRLGDCSTAAQFLTEPTGGPNAAASRRLARDFVSQGRDAEATEIYTRPLTEPELSHRARAEIELDSATVYAGSAESEDAAQTYERVARLAEETGALDLAVQARLGWGAMLALAADPRRALGAFRRGHTLARRLGERRMIARSLAGIGLAISQARPLDRGARWLRRAMREAERCGDMATVCWSAQVLFDIALEAGDHHLARQMSRLSIEIDSGLHRPRSLAASQARAQLLDTVHGELKPDPSGTWGTTSAHGETNREQVLQATVRFELLMLAGDASGARQAIEETCQTLADRRLLYPMLVDLLPRSAAACATLGDDAGLRLVIADFDELRADALSQIPVLGAIRASMEAQLASLDGAWEAAAAASHAPRAGSRI
jgi:tetratricopeptide (TPR) repeat protein